MTTSNMKDTKIAIDNMFTTNWTDTSIHWSGIDFNSTGIEKWINVVYEPQSNANKGVSGGATISTGAIYVVCWTEYQFDTMDLADTVVAFMNTNLPSGIINSEHSIIDQGFDPNGKAYQVLQFPIKSYIGVC